MELCVFLKFSAISILSIVLDFCHEGDEEQLEVGLDWDIALTRESVNMYRCIVKLQEKYAIRK